jgi:hypothetical protein
VHVFDQLGNGDTARQAPAQERVPHGDPQAAIFPHGIELSGIDFHRLARRFDAHEIIEVARRHKMRPVIEGIMARQLYHTPCGVFEQIRHIVAHQRSVVPKTFVDEMSQGVA